MPLFAIQSMNLDLPRNLALLDTNVLVAFANDRDGNHDQACLVVEEAEYEWLVPPPVVVEACGLLDRRRGRDYVLRLLTWLLTPGMGVRLLPDPNHPIELAQAMRGHSRWMQRYEVDFVDAYLMQIADKLTRACDLKPHAPVFTFDTQDYYKCSLQGYLFSLYDMKELDLIEFRRNYSPPVM